MKERIRLDSDAENREFAVESLWNGGFYSNWHDHISSLQGFTGDFDAILNHFASQEKTALESLDTTDRRILAQIQTLSPNLRVFQFKYAATHVNLFPFYLKWSDIPDAPSISPTTMEALMDSGTRSTPTHIEKLSINLPVQLIPDFIPLLPKYFELFAQFSHLHYLGISFIDARHFAHLIPKLTQLRQIYLFKTELEKIPQEWDHLVGITDLILGKNRIREISTLTAFRDLKFLDIQFNRVKELPENLGDLTRLERLILAHNEISRLPDSIGNLAQLTVLNTGHNKIGQLPDSFAHLHNLTTLILTKNKLTKIPDSLKDLSSLNFCALYENNLIEIPPWIKKSGHFFL